MGRLYAPNQDISPSVPYEYNDWEMYIQGNVRGDVVNTVMVPYGMTLVVYDSPGFTGDSETIVGLPYSDDREEMACQTLQRLGDRAQSAKVYRTKGPVVGYWEGITATESISTEYAIGLDLSESQMTQSSAEYDFSYEMSMGFEIEDLGAKDTISESYSESMEHDVQDTYSANFGIKYTQLCTQDESGGGVGFWQWKTRSFDGKNRVHSKYVLCRYGEHAYVPPACPWAACLNADCTECASDWKVASS